MQNIFVNKPDYYFYFASLSQAYSVDVLQLGVIYLCSGS